MRKTAFTVVVCRPQGADPGFAGGGDHGERAEQSPQRGPGAEPLVGVRGS